MSPAPTDPDAIEFAETLFYQQPDRSDPAFDHVLVTPTGDLTGALVRHDYPFAGGVLSIPVSHQRKLGYRPDRALSSIPLRVCESVLCVESEEYARISQPKRNGDRLTISEAAVKRGVSNHQIRRLIILAADQVVPDASYQIRANNLLDERVDMHHASDLG